MVYIELYLYDYLKKKKGGEKEEIELWGIYRGRDFYICHLRQVGDRKPFYEAHMQYLGNYRGLEGEDRRKPTLRYQKEDEFYSREAVVYIAKETEQIEHFLIKEKLRAAAGKSVPAKPGGCMPVKANGDPKGCFLKIVACLFLILLAANMIEALSDYESMKEVIEVAELLLK